MSFNVTQCPTCESTFNINSRVLEAAEGRVRCGACLNVFEATENFLDDPEGNSIHNQAESVFVGNDPQEFFDPSSFLTRSALTATANPAAEAAKTKDERELLQELEQAETVSEDFYTTVVEELHEREDTSAAEAAINAEPYREEERARQVDSATNRESTEGPDVSSSESDVLESFESEGDETPAEAVTADAEEPLKQYLEQAAQSPSQHEPPFVGINLSASFSYKPSFQSTASSSTVNSANDKTTEAELEKAQARQLGDRFEFEQLKDEDIESASNQQMREDWGHSDLEFLNTVATELNEESLPSTDLNWTVLNRTAAEQEVGDDKITVTDSLETSEVNPTAIELLHSSLPAQSHQSWLEAGENSYQNEAGYNPDSDTTSAAQKSSLLDWSALDSPHSFAGTDEYDQFLQRDSFSATDSSQSQDPMESTGLADPEVEISQPSIEEEWSEQNKSDEIEPDHVSVDTEQRVESQTEQNIEEESTEAIRARALETELEDEDALEAIPQENLAALGKMSTPVELLQRKESRLLRSILLFLTVILLAALLSAQYLWQRMDVYSQLAQIRPFYEFACGYLSCDLPQYSDIDAIRSDNLTVRSHPELSNGLMVNTIIRNTAAFPQAFPVLILSFNSAENSVIALREFAVAEYLDPELQSFSLMPVMTPVQINLAIMDPGPGAVNYTLAFRLP